MLFLLGLTYEVPFSVNNPDFDSIWFMWEYMVQDNSLYSPNPRRYTIKRGEDFSGTVKIISDRPRTEQELKNMISFTAMDQGSKQYLLVNGKRVSFADASSPGSSKGLIYQITASKGKQTCLTVLRFNTPFDNLPYEIHERSLFSCVVYYKKRLIHLHFI